MNIFKKVSLFLILLVILVLPVFIHGQKNTPPSYSNTNINIPNPLNCDAGQDCSTLLGLLTVLLNNVVMPIAAVAVVLWIIWAGFTYVTAQDKPAEIQQAHPRILWSLVGAGILLGAAGISAVVERTINQVIGK